MNAPFSMKGAAMKVMAFLRKPVVAALCGAVVAGVATAVVMEQRATNQFMIENREYKAAQAEIAIRAAARIRQGRAAEAVRFLEDAADGFAVGVPMGERYQQMTPRCQRGLVLMKLYHSRYPYVGPCPLHGETLHTLHLPQMLAGVPMATAANSEWLDDAMQALRQMPEAKATQ
jgi:hypothetical protein